MKQEEGEKACIMALLHIWDIFRDSSAAVSVPAHSQNTQCTLQHKNIIRNTECSALCSEYTLMPCNAIRAFFRPKIDKMQRWRVKIRFQRHLAMFVKQLQWKVTLSSGRIFGISRFRLLKCSPVFLPLDCKCAIVVHFCWIYSPGVETNREASTTIWSQSEFLKELS